MAGSSVHGGTAGGAGPARYGTLQLAYPAPTLLAPRWHLSRVRHQALEGASGTNAPLGRQGALRTHVLDAQHTARVPPWVVWSPNLLPPLPSPSIPFDRTPPAPCHGVASTPRSPRVLSAVPEHLTQRVGVLRQAARPLNRCVGGHLRSAGAPRPPSRPRGARPTGSALSANWPLPGSGVLPCLVWMRVCRKKGWASLPGPTAAARQTWAGGMLPARQHACAVLHQACACALPRSSSQQ